MEGFAATAIIVGLAVKKAAAFLTVKAWPYVKANYNTILKAVADSIAKHKIVEQIKDAQQDANSMPGHDEECVQSCPLAVREQYDAQKAIKHLDEHAKASWEEAPGLCAQYVREAIEAGGLTLERTRYAKDYGGSLLNAGFSKVDINLGEYAPQIGDIAIFEASSSIGAGHMQMYNGEIWVSDHRQRSPNHPGGAIYPGRSFEDVMYSIYRW